MLYRLICLVFYYIYSCSELPVSQASKNLKRQQQKLETDAMCEHLGVHKAVLNALHNIIDTVETIKKSRCLQAYLTPGPKISTKQCNLSQSSNRKRRKLLHFYDGMETLSLQFRGFTFAAEEWMTRREKRPRQMLQSLCMYQECATSFFGTASINV